MNLNPEAENLLLCSQAYHCFVKTNRACKGALALCLSRKEEYSDFRVDPSILQPCLMCLASRKQLPSQGWLPNCREEWEVAVCLPTDDFIDRIRAAHQCPVCCPLLPPHARWSEGEAWYG
ncbi:unnamed protein product [Victoria cruziana]